MAVPARRSLALLACGLYLLAAMAGDDLGLPQATLASARRRRQQRRQAPPPAKVKDDFDPYETLGVDDEATIARSLPPKLSMKYHPDKNKGNAEAKRSFRPSPRPTRSLGRRQKALYDAGGMELVEEGSREQPQDPFAAFKAAGEAAGWKRQLEEGRTSR